MLCSTMSPGNGKLGTGMNNVFARLFYNWPAHLSVVLLLQCLCSGDAAQFDGPAELPRVYVRSALSDTPAPGKRVAVREGDDLQLAINNASCGDQLELQAGTVFSGIFRFPEKPCDDAHWIIVRSSASDTDLPSEGNRLTPCWAGVTALPSRPDLHCATVHNVLAKIELNAKSGVGPFLFQAGANHYRFVGLEIARAPGPLVSALSIAPEGAR